MESTGQSCSRTLHFAGIHIFWNIVCEKWNYQTKSKKSPFSFECSSVFSSKLL